MSFDPEASKLVLYKQLSTLTRGAKVRFLACVQAYDIATGRLKVVDSFTSQSAKTYKVRVDVQNILESLDNELLQVGAIINIIGYVQRRKLNRQQPDASKDHESKTSDRIEINAITIWNAGAVQIDEYEAIVLRLQQAVHA